MPLKRPPIDTKKTAPVGLPAPKKDHTWKLIGTVGDFISYENLKEETTVLTKKEKADKLTKIGKKDA